ncbi:MAG: AraC family ligand binding domain-containing protein [Anaerolineales bacterium]|nr:AraC family ligand binding domain-containing protein [Anaerolineales bacterium]MCB9128979.1 AraC family ligand binding domain-containing protein [Ardenticatenales bacterium]
MKITLADRSAFTADDGHRVREMVGLPTMNVEKYSVAHVVAPAGSTGTTRVNQFDEILLVIAGRGTATLDHAEYELGPNDLLLLPAGTRYTVSADAAAPLEMWALCVPAFRPEWSQQGSARRDWRDYQTPRGADRLRPSNS